MKLILKLFLVCLTSTVLIVFLAGGLLLLILSLLRWLFTGKRPQIVTLMSTVNQWKRGNLWSFNGKNSFTSSSFDTSGATSNSPFQRSSDNIVDIEVKDITQTQSEMNVQTKAQAQALSKPAISDR